MLGDFTLRCKLGVKLAMFAQFATFTCINLDVRNNIYVLGQRKIGIFIKLRTIPRADRNLLAGSIPHFKSDPLIFLHFLKAHMMIE